MVALCGLLSLLVFSSLAFAQRIPQDETCDPEWYGRPANQDCKNALARLPDWRAVSQNGNANPGIIRQFVNDGRWTRVGSSTQEDEIRTPLSYTHGAQSRNYTIIARMLADCSFRDVHSSRPTSERHRHHASRHD